MSDTNDNQQVQRQIEQQEEKTKEREQSLYTYEELVKYFKRWVDTPPFSTERLTNWWEYVDVRDGLAIGTTRGKYFGRQVTLGVLKH